MGREPVLSLEKIHLVKWPSDKEGFSLAFVHNTMSIPEWSIYPGAEQERKRNDPSYEHTSCDT